MSTVRQVWPSPAWAFEQRSEEGVRHGFLGGGARKPTTNSCTTAHRTRRLWLACKRRPSCTSYTILDLARPTWSCSPSCLPRSWHEENVNSLPSAPHLAGIPPLYVHSYMSQCRRPPTLFIGPPPNETSSRRRNDEAVAGYSFCCSTHGDNSPFAAVCSARLTGGASLSVMVDFYEGSPGTRFPGSLARPESRLCQAASSE